MTTHEPNGDNNGAAHKPASDVDPSVNASLELAASQAQSLELGSERLSVKEVFDVQVNELTKRFADAMPSGTSRFDWAPDLMADLERQVRQIQEKGDEARDVLSLLTPADLVKPREWNNENGEMDAVNLFFSEFGAVNRDQVLVVVQTQINQGLSSNTEGGGGSVDFESGIPGVHTKIKYGYTGKGEIAYIQPEIVIDPNVEVTA